MERLNKIRKKIMKNDFGIIFGMLSGTGLVVLLSSLISLLKSVLPVIEPYSFAIYSSLFLFVLIGTTINYTIGWFKMFYLTSSLLFFIVQIYVEFFGVIK